MSQMAPVSQCLSDTKWDTFAGNTAAEDSGGLAKIFKCNFSTILLKIFDLLMKISGLRILLLSLCKSFYD